MPSPMENIEANVYNNILDAAFNDAKERFPRMVYSKKNPRTGEFSDGRSINDFVDGLNNSYVRKGLFVKGDFVNPKLKNTAVASAKAVQIIYNLCVENEINNSIDHLLETPEFAAQGNDHTRTELKNRVREFLDSDNITENDKKLAESIRTSFNKFNGNQSDYIYNAFNYIDEFNRNIIERNIDPDIAMNVSGFKAGTPMKFDADIAGDLRSAFGNYAEEKGDTIKVSTVYRSGEVNPLTFLQHYNENPDSLSKKEREFASNFFSDINMSLAVQEVMTGSGNGNMRWKDFTSNGRQIISEDENGQFLNGIKSESDMECKIVAEILAGNDVCAKSSESKGTKIHIQPQIICRDPESFIDRIIAMIKEFFTKGREKNEINAANEKYSDAAEKNKDIYEEISFDQLMNEKPSEKLTRKPAEKQKEKEMENEIDAVIIGR